MAIGAVKGFSMYFDPMYFLFLAPAFVFSLWASWRTKSNFKKYSKVPVSTGLSGAEAARRVLDGAKVRDVEIVRSRGFLSDHYNPIKKTLALSDGVFDSRSVAAVGIAAHEAGDAIQHAQHYGPLKLRSMLVPTASIGSNLGYMVMLFGLILSSQNMVMVGAATHLLPIEGEILEQFIKDVFTRKGERVVETNLKAFQAGIEAATS